MNKPCIIVVSRGNNARITWSDGYLYQAIALAESFGGAVLIHAQGDASPICLSTELFHQTL